MALAAFSLTFAACEKDDGVGVEDDGTEETPGGDDTEDPDDNEDAVTFTISVTDITATGATVSVVPSDKTITYYFDVLSESDVAQYESVDAAVEDFIAYILEYNAEYGEDLTDLVSVDDDSWDYAGALSANTEYYAFAVGVTVDGVLTTAIETTTFTTADVEAVDMTFNISVDGGLVTVTPSDNDEPYIWSVYSGSLTNASDEEIVADVLYGYEGYESWLTVTGTDSYDYSADLTNGLYTVVAFGYNGGVTTPVTRCEFTYEGGDDAEPDSDTNVTSDIELTDVTLCKATCYGNYYESGTCNWDITLKNENGDSLYAEMFTEASQTTSPVGTFTLDPESTYKAGTALCGMLYDGYIYSSSYMSADSKTWACLVSGTITVTASGDNYNVVFNTADSQGHKLTCNYTGTISIDDSSSEYPFSVSASGKSFGKSSSVLRKFSSVPGFGQKADLQIMRKADLEAAPTKMVSRKSVNR